MRFTSTSGTLSLSGLIIGLSPTRAPAAQSTSAPNVVIIFADVVAALVRDAEAHRRTVTPGKSLFDQRLSAVEKLPAKPR